MIALGTLLLPRHHTPRSSPSCATPTARAPPLWWPLPPLLISGVLVALAISRLPGGGGGHSPADGFHAGGTPPAPAELPGILLAALAGLGLGVVVGPKAPLIALGAGLGVCAVRLSRRDVPARAQAMVAASGSFAAISALLGSPILGAFLLMESAGLGGATLGMVLLPGLLASGIGFLVFVGLDSLTGLGVPTLALPDVPPFAHPDIVQFGYAILIGLLAAPMGIGVRRLALIVRPHVDRHRLALTPLVGLLVGILAVGYAATTGNPTTDVLFSGQSALGPLLDNSAGYPLGALLILLACKGLAYALSLSSFRGGPIFPAMFVGAAGGIALSHLPGLPAVAGAAMGIAAMSTVMLKLPMTSVLLATLLLTADGLRRATTDIGNSGEDGQGSRASTSGGPSAVGTDVPDVVLLHGEFGGLAESGVKWTGAVRGGG